MGILQLSPQQAICLGVCIVIAQCSFRVIKPFTIVQILFDVGNVTTATALAWWTFAIVMRTHPESAPVLALAVTVYFLANTVPLALVLGWVSESSPFRLWRQEFLWYLPFYLVGAMLAVLADFIGIHFGWLTSLLLIPMVYTVYRAYCAQMALIRDREQHIREVEALQLRTIEGHSMAIEAKDEGTHDHLMRVRVYAEELGRIMQLEAPLMKALHTAAFLHDIGKLAVPSTLLISRANTVVRLDFPALVERLMHTQACLPGLSNVDPEPNAMTNIWLSSSPNHQWSPSEKTPATLWEAEIDRLMNRQAVSATDAERKKDIDRVQQIVADQQPFIYLAYPNALVAFSPHLHGVEPAILTPRLTWNAQGLRLEGAR